MPIVPTALARHVALALGLTLIVGLSVHDADAARKAEYEAQAADYRELLAQF